MTDGGYKIHGRKQPYTEIGIGRVPCIKCGSKPSVHQWQVCADDRLFRPLCEKCDIELNEMVLRWAFPSEMSEPKIAAYRSLTTKNGDMP